MVGELPTLRARGNAGLLADNFLDMAHFPFVHAGTFGADEAAEVPPYSVARDGWSFTVAYEHQFAHREDPGVAAGLRPLIQTRRLTYQLCAPFHLRLRIDFLDAGGSNVIGFFIQPETAETCRLYTTLWRDDLGGRSADAWRRRSNSRWPCCARTCAIQEAYHDLVLPLDPRGRGAHPGRPHHVGTAPGPGRPGHGGRGVNATVVDHPVLAHRVAQLRDRATGGDTFRQLVSEVSGLLAYEALRDLGSAEIAVDTPVTDGAPAHRVSEVVLLVPILRAGLGMVQAIQEVVPLTEVAHVGLRRDDGTLAIRRLPQPPAPRPGRAPGGGLRSHAGDGGSLGAGLRHRGRTGSAADPGAVHHRLGTRAGRVRGAAPGRARVLRRHRSASSTSSATSCPAWGMRAIASSDRPTSLTGRCPRARRRGWPRCSRPSRSMHSASSSSTTRQPCSGHPLVAADEVVGLADHHGADAELAQQAAAVPAR